MNTWKRQPDVSKTSNWKGVEDVGRMACQRLRQARIYNGYTIEEAAERFGWTADNKKTQLSLIENAERLPPLWVMVRAVRIYGVPMDYIMGFVDESESTAHDVERAAIQRYVERTMAENGRALFATMTRMISGSAPAVTMSRSLVEVTGEVLDAFKIFRTRNPEFDELVGGPRLVRAVELLVEQHSHSKHTIECYDTLGERAMQIEEQRLGKIKPMFLSAEPL